MAAFLFNSTGPTAEMESDQGSLALLRFLLRIVPNRWTLLAILAVWWYAGDRK